MKEKLYSKLAEQIYLLCGMHYPEKDYYRLDARIRELIMAYKIESEEALLKILSNKLSNEHQQTLIDIATNNETYFLRDNKPFNAVASTLVPELIDSGTDPIRIWCAGCSTGQEPYSILMSIEEANPTLNSKSIAIDATDISEQALETAKNGLYSTLAVQRGLPIQMLLKYFKKTDNEETWNIDKKLTERVGWNFFNLFSDKYPYNKYNIVFCRNVVIYQTLENKKKIITSLFSSIKPGGCLIMGSGESLIGIDIPYNQRSINGCMVFQKPE